MAETSYTYSISTDFPGGAVNPAKLKDEITASNSGITIQVERIDTSGDTLTLVMKDALPAAQKTLLDGDTTAPAGGLIASHDNSKTSDATPVSLTEKKTADDRIRVAIEKSEGSRLTVVSHDWADKTTWAQGSLRVVDEIATDSGDHLTYNLAHQNVIDTYHGKLFDEDNLRDSAGNSYRVSVLVNDVTKTEQDPHVGSGGDYTVDYAAGKVIFNAALAPTDVVKVTYYYAASSKIKVIPSAGKRIHIEGVDVQFSTDVVLNDTAVFEMVGAVEVFAPQLVNDVNPDYATSFPTGTKIPLATTRYKTMRDFQNECDRSYPSYPAIGGSGWRGLQVSTQVFHWEYVRSVIIESAKGMELHIYLEHDSVFTGEYATSTLYCVSEDET